MRGLKTGEMAIYDDQEQSVHLTRDGIVIRGAGKPMRLTDTSEIELDSFGTAYASTVMWTCEAGRQPARSAISTSTAVQKATTYPARRRLAGKPV